MYRVQMKNSACVGCVHLLNFHLEAPFFRYISFLNICISLLRDASKQKQSTSDRCYFADLFALYFTNFKSFSNKSLRIFGSERTQIWNLLSHNVHLKMMKIRGDRNAKSTPMQNWSKYKKFIFKKYMVYMNWEVIWSATIPYVGLSWARIGF